MAFTQAMAPGFINQPLRLSINVQLPPYSAIGDGVTDDTAAFSSWASDLGTDGVGSVPVGTYSLTALPSIARTSRVAIAPGAIVLLSSAPQQWVSVYHPQSEPVNVLRETFASGSSTTTTGSMASGSTSLTGVGNTVGWSVGMGISVVGAGVSGALLVTQVTAISGSVFTLSTAASSSVSNAVVTHDDTVAVQSAINAAAGVAPCIIGGAGYTFVLSSSLSIPSNSHLILDGTLSMVSGAASTINGVINLGSSSGICIEGCGVIDGNGQNQPPNTAGGQGAIIAGNVGDYSGPGASKVQIRGITIQNVLNWPWNIVASSDVVIDSVRVENCGNSANFSAGCVDCWCYACRMNTITNDMGFTVYGNSQRCGFVGCRASNVHDIGFNVFSDQYSPGACHHISFSNCIATACGACGFGAESVVGGTLTTPDVHTNLSYEGCHTYGCGSRQENGPGDMQFSQAMDNVLITGCVITNSQNVRGIMAFGSNFLISNNLVRNIDTEGASSPAGRGISLNASSTAGQGGPYIVRDNVITDTQGTHTLLYGLELAAPGGSSYTCVKLRGGSVTGLASGGQAVYIPSGQGWHADVEVSGIYGYNPVGALSAPSVPASGATVINPFSVRARVFVSGGSVTAIAISGIATGLTAGMFIVDAGESISLTYSATPAWVWIGE